MEQKFLFASDNTETCSKEMEVGDTVLVNFSRDFKASEYCFFFENNNYSSLTFTFLSDLAIDCYFVFVLQNEHPKFTGYHTLQKEKMTVDVKNCSKFYIVIPRNKNTEVCTPLTLVSFDAE